MFLALFVVITVIHLFFDLTHAHSAADATQVLLMPPLAWSLISEWRRSTGGRPRPALVRLTLWALFFSWLGDTLPRFFDSDSDAGFIVMVLAFLCAQVSYIRGFAPYRHRSVRFHSRGWMLFYVVALVVLWALTVPDAGVMAVAVIIYGLCLTTMAIRATGVHLLTWIGGSIFMLSDGLIALDAFDDSYHFGQQDFVVMLTYCVAQLLITRGVLATARETVPQDARAPLTA